MPKLAALASALLLMTGPALAAPNETAPAPAAQSARTNGVMRYDTNKDGAVDREEWNAGQQARFKQLDANGDGKLSQDELFARTPTGASSVLPTDRQHSRQSAFFQRMDADRDGVVTLVEFMSQADKNFARCDVDRNARIDAAECRQALQPRRTQR